MSELKWTKENPSVPGWYRLREKGKNTLGISVLIFEESGALQIKNDATGEDLNAFLERWNLTYNLPEWAAVEPE